MNHKKGRAALSKADQCYTCNRFFIERKSLKRHLNNCGCMPGVVYKFENQSIQTFFDNVKFMGDLLFVIYFDFETTCDKKTYNFDNDASMCHVSYAIMVAIQPNLNLDILFVVRSFNHTFDQLNSVG